MTTSVVSQVDDLTSPEPTTVEKLRGLILHICIRSEDDEAFGAVKLNKLLFFSDFLAFVRLGKAITGQEYQKLDHGPAPRRMLLVIREMERSGVIRQRNVCAPAKMTAKRSLLCERNDCTQRSHATCNLREGHLHRNGTTHD